MKQRKAVGAIAIAIVFGIAGWLVGSRTNNDDGSSWLFSHTATAGTVTTNADGSLIVMLSGVNPHVIAFTDRPDRDAGITAASDFYDSWETLFADAAPNAVLVEHLADGSTDSLVVTMYSPTLTDDGLQFRAVLLEDEKHPERLKRLIGMAHADMPTSVGEATLFIDSVMAGPDYCRAHPSYCTGGAEQ